MNVMNGVVREICVRCRLDRELISIFHNFQKMAKLIVIEFKACGRSLLTMKHLKVVPVLHGCLHVAMSVCN